MAQRVRVAVGAASCDIFCMTADGLPCVASFDRSGYDERPVGDLLDLHSCPTVVAAMNSHQTLIITSPDDPQLGESERRTYREYVYASEMCVPLVVNNELHGLIDIYDTRERDYTEYLSFLKSAAQTRDLGETLGARVLTAIEAADCDIYTLQGESLRCVVSADGDGFDETVAGTILDMNRFPATAMAVRSREAMAVAGLNDPRLSPQERASMGEYSDESELCIPLVVDERVIGLIDVFDTRSRDYGEYLDPIVCVAQPAAAAIQIAWLPDEHKHILAGQADDAENSV